MAKSSEVLPEWVKQAGGEVIWRKWIERKVEACQRRAKKWADKRQDKRPRPRGKEWRAAIYKAIRDSEGRGCYSHLPLSLNRGDEPPARGEGAKFHCQKLPSDRYNLRVQ